MGKIINEGYAICICLVGGAKKMYFGWGASRELRWKILATFPEWSSHANNQNASTTIQNRGCCRVWGGGGGDQSETKDLKRGNHVKQLWYKANGTLVIL